MDENAIVYELIIWNNTYLELDEPTNILNAPFKQTENNEIKQNKTMWLLYELSICVLGCTVRCYLCEVIAGKGQTTI